MEFKIVNEEYRNIDTEEVYCGHYDSFEISLAKTTAQIRDQ